MSFHDQEIDNIPFFGREQDKEKVESFDSNSDNGEEENENEETALDDTEESLAFSTQLLFFLNGAIVALPTLALSSLINDRISIPPAYLPAYYAIAFIPYSLRPIYAFITRWIRKYQVRCQVSTFEQGDANEEDSDDRNKGLLLSILQAFGGICIFVTGFLQAGHVVQCFLLGFSQAVFISWSEFILGLSLIDVAQLKAFSPSTQDYDDMTTTTSQTPLLLHSMHHGDNNDGQTCSNNNGIRDDYIRERQKAREEMLLSLYQSQAATSRNIGSFIAQLLLFTILFFRKIHIKKRQQQYLNDVSSEATAQQDILSDEFVTVIFILTSMLLLIGSISAFVGNVGVRYRQDVESSFDEHVGSNSCDDAYHRFNHDDDTTTTHALRPETNNKGQDHEQEQIRYKQQDSQYTTLQDASRRSKYSDITAILLFQIILVVSGLKTPIISISSMGLWNAIMLLLCISLLVAILWPDEKNTSGACRFSSYFNTLQQKEPLEVSYNDSSMLPPNENDNGDIHVSQMKDSSSRCKRVALYLTLRHSVPNSSIILYNYIYTVFRKHPLFLQIVSILESFVAVLSSSFYQKKIAKRFSSVSGVTTIIVITTVIGCMLQMLYIPLIKLTQEVSNEDSAESNIKSHGWWLKMMLGFAIVEVMTSFVSELSFLPSIILATTCSEERETITGSYLLERRVTFVPSSESDDDVNSFPTQEGTRIIQHEEDIALNCRHYKESNDGLIGRSVQYGVLVSCIDFGDQIGSWIAVPLIAYLQIERDNQWAHLEWFITLCSIASFLSLGFLKLIQQYSIPNQTQITDQIMV